jgi:hypothetical protein
MKWEEIRARYPHEWLLVEAIEAHSENGKRILDKLVVIDVFPNSQEAMRGYAQLHRQGPTRELFVLHTDRESLDIEERRRLGLRGVK